MTSERLIGVDDLIDRIREYNPRTDDGMIRMAYAYAARMHHGQIRQSGEIYFTHPVEVAMILAQMQLDDQTIITALLHDTIEDTKSTFAEIAKRFSEEIAELVDGVTKLTNLELSSRETKQAENFRKLFMAMSKDLRVILVKLADRLHNMRTIRHMKPEKQVQKSRETMDIYAPLAGRMGMQWMRDELEDLAFQVLNPEGRTSIMRRFVKLQQDTGDAIDNINSDIIAEMQKHGIGAKVYGRAKKPFSIWRKMQEKKLSFSRLSDIYGFRVLVGSEEECYRVLGTIHQRWRAVPGRFKDYISQPKSNGYRSIHTTVSGRDGKRVEVQIRTHQMHDVAESGVAAHWSYKDGQRSENPFAVDPSEWFSDLTERLAKSDSHQDFLEAVKLEMYADQVFCFTPKGDVVKLPRGATPLDFAYAVHTRVGDNCVGAKIDHMRVPLWTRIKNGQMVDIMTAGGQRPQSSWLDIVITGRAKAAIRRSLRVENRERFVKLGTELARVAFDHVGKKASDKALSTAARQFGLNSPDELLARIGSAEISARDVVQLLYPTLAPKQGEEIDASRAIIGLERNQQFTQAACCRPIPGERMAGISYPGLGVLIHAIDCAALEDIEDSNRWHDLYWHSGPHRPVHRACLELTIRNDAGVLGRICTLIGEQSANISDLRFVDRKPDFYRLIIDVELRDVQHLMAVLTVLEADSDVASVNRYRDITKKP